MLSFTDWTETLILVGKHWRRRRMWPTLIWKMINAVFECDGLNGLLGVVYVRFAQD